VVGVSGCLRVLVGVVRVKSAFRRPFGIFDSSPTPPQPGKGRSYRGAAGRCGEGPRLGVPRHGEDPSTPQDGNKLPHGDQKLPCNDARALGPTGRTIYTSYSGAGPPLLYPPGPARRVAAPLVFCCADGVPQPATGAIAC